MFDLPDRLTRKADPTLIAGDELHFAGVAESLEQLITDVSDRLDALRKEPGGTGEAALDRNLEIPGRFSALVAAFFTGVFEERGESTFAALAVAPQPPHQQGCNPKGGQLRPAKG